MNPKSFLTTAGTIFLIVAVMHFLRVINSWEANIGTWAVPMWLSWVVFLLLGYLAYQGLSKR
ncbi:MAG: hypothetical protein NUV78_01920 [Candidatus Zambryskibacteria bacterium]|nr:hypothetical protein [Candidatus Zambryskibacteria bacterium]